MTAILGYQYKFCYNYHPATSVPLNKTPQFHVLIVGLNLILLRQIATYTYTFSFFLYFVSLPDHKNWLATKPLRLWLSFFSRAILFPSEQTFLVFIAFTFISHKSAFLCILHNRQVHMIVKHTLDARHIAL